MLHEITATIPFAIMSSVIQTRLWHPRLQSYRREVSNCVLFTADLKFPDNFSFSNKVGIRLNLHTFETYQKKATNFHF